MRRVQVFVSLLLFLVSVSTSALPVSEKDTASLLGSASALWLDIEDAAPPVSEIEMYELRHVSEIEEVPEPVNEREHTVFGQAERDNPFLNMINYCVSEPKREEASVGPDDVDHLSKVLEILLSKDQAADSERYKREVLKAQMIVAEQILPTKDYNYDELIYSLLPRPFAQRYDLNHVLSWATAHVKEAPEYKNCDYDNLMTEILINHFVQSDSEEYGLAEIKKTLADARKIVTLANAIRQRKIDDILKLLQEYSNIAKNGYRYLVELAAEVECLEALKELLEFSQNPKDAGAALLVLMKTRVPFEITEGQSGPRNAYREMIEFLIADRRITSLTLQKIQNSVNPLLREAGMRKMWNTWIKDKRKWYSDEEKRLADEGSEQELNELRQLKHDVDGGGSWKTRCYELVESARSCIRRYR